MTDCNNNNIVSVERDICTGIGNNTICQLNKLRVDATGATV